ncbi:MAG: Gfo/Idh/MocA family oxidoreductase [Candidatus Competibacteraceae bacterium]|nr:Gfo/Idh/MocA family oxidoreductase [Candidatus Competibacteraceae bacterium]
MISPHILIVGSGSVGRRHARNLHALGCRISCLDPREERLAELAAEVPVVGRFKDLGDALRGAAFDGVVIGSPPNVHVEQAMACLSAGLPVLLEKPVSADLASAQRLAAAARRSPAPVLLGYTWRWWPPLQRVRELLATGAVGTLHHVQFHMSAHLADWHPWERYQDFFMAHRALGGGALLDESHWIDLALWMFGMPETISASVEKLSELEIDTDDNVDLLLRYRENLRVSVHLDIFGRPHEKYIRFVGEKGTLLWTVEPNRIAIGGAMSGWDTVETFDCERNDMFVSVAREFLSIIGGASAMTCCLDDGVRVLQVIETARRASNEGRTLPLEGT